MPRARIPWPPEIPARIRNVLAPFTVYDGGWCRWHNGRMIHVCGKATPPDQVEACWRRKVSEVESRDAQPVRRRAGEDAISLADAADLYGEWLERRVTVGKPTPLSRATAEDYKRTLIAFGRFVGADVPLNRIPAGVFGNFAQTFDANAPSTLARIVAGVQAFFQWCADEGYVDAVPQYGRSFVKPAQQHHRDKRIAESKSYTPMELRALWFYADFTEKLWIAMGLNGAMDNSDLANLTEEVIDRKAKVFDYRRRKRGKVRRVIPMLPIVADLLDLYERPAPAAPEYADRFLLTPTGLPLQRFKHSEASGRTNPIDYVAMCWTRLMIRAGLRPPMPQRKAPADGEPQPERRIKAKGSAAGQGFRALRTTFGNLAPPGYRDEVEIVLGHSKGTVLLDNYLERCGTERLTELVTHVWASAFTSA